jgi:hypothetical protein
MGDYKYHMTHEVKTNVSYNKRIKVQTQISIEYFGEFVRHTDYKRLNYHTARRQA